MEASSGTGDRMTTRVGEFRASAGRAVFQVVAAPADTGTPGMFAWLSDPPRLPSTLPALALKVSPARTASLSPGQSRTAGHRS